MPQRKFVHLNDVVEEIIGLVYSRANRSAVSIRTDLDAELPVITADRVQLQQVLMNLTVNGIEAMKETGGELTIASRLAYDGEVLILGSDTGLGFPVEIADQMFNAFVTTKPQGSGMGLAISRSIVESHGSRLWASNNSGRGRLFTSLCQLQQKRSNIIALQERDSSGRFTDARVRTSRSDLARDSEGKGACLQKLIRSVSS
jgi:signal transduction histidine kinase